jgi:peptidoglycan/xylan/chitin deacetylase (PgdA/CDA1 family)
LIQTIKDYLKNVGGWRPTDRYVVLAFDDYGNMRLRDGAAADALTGLGQAPRNHFDVCDHLETRADLEAMRDVLGSVTDVTGRSAVLSAYFTPANLDFDALKSWDASSDPNPPLEPLNQTFERATAHDRAAYAGAWDLWQELFAQEMAAPYYHGRQHFNTRAFVEKWRDNDAALHAACAHGSLARLASRDSAGRKIYAALDIGSASELPDIAAEILDGADRFEAVFGHRARVFNPPAGRAHPHLHGTLSEAGLWYLEAPYQEAYHLGDGKRRTFISRTGDFASASTRKIVRNVVFEPGPNGIEASIKAARASVNAAFRMSKPAIISSHRVNFGTYIDPEYGKANLEALRKLLQLIRADHPTIRFISTYELGVIMDDGRPV